MGKPNNTKTKTREPERRASPPAAQKPSPSQSSKAIATTKGGGSAPSAAAMQSEGGGGLSQRMEDNLVPLLYVLTSTSPQINSRDPKYVEDAEAGDIWLRNDSDPIVKGDDGVLVQFCGMYSEWVEWIPRESGGGIAGRYKDRPKEAVQDDDNPNKWWLGDNELIDTRNVILNVYRDPSLPPDNYVMPLKSTGHGVARAWMTNMNKKRLPNGAKPDAWACLYLMKSQTRTNKKGTWCLPEIHDVRENGKFAGWASDEQYEWGQATHDAFETGVKRAQDEDADHRGDGGGDEDTSGEV